MEQAPRVTDVWRPKRHNVNINNITALDHPQTRLAGDVEHLHTNTTQAPHVNSHVNPPSHVRSHVHVTCERTCGRVNPLHMCVHMCMSHVSAHVGM